MSYDQPYGGETDDGWKELIEVCHRKLKYIDPDYKIVQIKEKFGGLRYYFSTDLEFGSIAHEIMADIVSSAERMAGRTCESCGTSRHREDVENRSVRGWYKTYCANCFSIKTA